MTNFLILQIECMVTCLLSNDCERIEMFYPDPFSTQNLQCAIHNKPYIMTEQENKQNWVISDWDKGCPTGFNRFNTAAGCYKFLCDGTWKASWQNARDACDAIKPWNVHLAGKNQGVS